MTEKAKTMIDGLLKLSPEEISQAGKVLAGIRIKLSQSDDPSGETAIGILHYLLYELRVEVE